MVKKISRISWNQNQVSRLQNSIRTYNEVVKRMGMSGNYEYVPEFLNFAVEKSRITTRQQLYTRLAQIQRINKPNASDAVIREGHIIPRYLSNEIGYAIRNLNKGRRDFRLSYIPDDISDVEFATAISGKNFADIDVNGYYTGEDLADLLDELFPDMGDKGRVGLYISLFEDNMTAYDGYKDAIEVITLMSKYYPDKLREIFESNLMEVDINYIYPESPLPEVGSKRTFKVGNRTYNYKSGEHIAANQTEEKTRIEKTINFWKYVGNYYGVGSYNISDEGMTAFKKDPDFLDKLTYKPRRKQNKGRR